MKRSPCVAYTGFMLQQFQLQLAQLLTAGSILGDSCQPQPLFKNLYLQLWPFRICSFIPKVFHPSRRNIVSVCSSHLDLEQGMLHTTRQMRRKCKHLLRTLRHQKGRLRTAQTALRQRSYAMKRRPFQALF